MKKIWNVAEIALALGCLVACGDGEVSKPTGEDETLYYLQDSSYYAERMSAAVAACEKDPACAGKLGDVSRSSSFVSSSSFSEISSSVESSGSIAVSSSSEAVSSSSISSSSVSSSSFSEISSSGESSSSFAVSSSSEAISSSSISSSSVSSSSSEAASSSSVVYEDRKLVYGEPEVEFSAGAYKVYSTNEWSGILRCRANAETVVRVNGEKVTVGTSLASIEGATPRLKESVALIVPENSSVFCKAEW